MRMTLERVGPVEWDTLRKQLREAEAHCAWSDFGGFHLAAAALLPESIPAATHLWAWDAARAIRARIDVERVLAAVLHTTPPLEPVAGPLASVEVQVRTGRLWGVDDPPMGCPGSPLPDQEFTLLEIAGPSPAVFVRQEALIRA
ncbi:hypothetical protein ACH4U7_31550 [Streptomyces sp. NPDC020845]|uniref:hypothetical protein n=1 Tax=Streptomyces sp. NPDC020845 TaxID=3365096 RepID=UPI0037A54500